MIHRRRRLAARFLAVGLLAAALFTVDSVTSHRPAEARCNGVNNPVKSTFSYGGYVRVSETPGAGTCNGNNIYTGTIKDERADGYCVTVKFKEAGFDWMIPDDGTACGGTSTFQWHDINGNRQAYQQLCISNGATGEAYCGWGDKQGNQYYALNSGY
jgi:hypothetical protein